MHFKTSLKNIIALLIGLFFIFSAVSKLINIDSFELYIFGLKIFNFTVSSILARVVIGSEIFIGILLLHQKTKKAALILATLMLVGFSLWLIYRFYINPDEHCHCLGEVIKMKPLPSILKNILLIGLLAFIAKSEGIIKYRIRFFAIGTIMISVTIPFFISVPDSFAIFTPREINQNKFDLLQKAKKNNLEYCFEGKRIICFFSAYCEHCKKAAKKISIMADKYNLRNNVTFLFMGEEKDVVSFYNEIEIDSLNSHVIAPQLILNVSNGEFPTICFVDNGMISKTFNYRELTESKIKEFFNTKQ